MSKISKIMFRHDEVSQCELHSHCSSHKKCSYTDVQKNLEFKHNHNKGTWNTIEDFETYRAFKDHTKYILIE